MSQIPREKRGRIPDHRHCIICGKAIPPKEEICSDECRKIQAYRLRRERRTRILILILYVILMGSLLLIFFRPI
jgi:predicted nucleic acid-binding Zn ribbon protein